MDCTDCILYDYCIGDTSSTKICGRFIDKNSRPTNYNGDPIKYYYNLYFLELDNKFIWQVLESSNNTGPETIVAEGEEKELNTAIQKACAARVKIKWKGGTHHGHA